MTRRGGILFEMLIAVAIFVGAGTLTLQIVGNGFDGLERTHRHQLAVDLARSKLAELEAGMININDLTNGVIETVGSLEMVDMSAPVGLDTPQEEWLVEADTSRTEFSGLTLVELTVFFGPEDDAPSVTLRRLVRLREQSVDEYEQDELIEDLPMETTGP